MSAANPLFNRLVVLQLNDREYVSNPGRGRRGFAIDASLTLKGPQGNEAVISLTNPAPEITLVSLLADRRDLRVRLLAGYGDPGDETVVFDGNIIRNGATLIKKAPDRVLKIKAKEGAVAFNKLVQISVDGNIAAREIVPELYKQVEIPPAQRDSGLVLPDPERRFPEGYYALGPARQVLLDLGDSLDADLWVNRGFLEVTEKRAPRTREGPVFSPELRNLLEAPQPKDKGLVEIKTPLQPRLSPRDRFELRDTFGGILDGFYTITEHRMSISSGYGGQFDSKIIGRPDRV